MAATLLTTEDVNWDLERLAFNILIDQQPFGIALPRSADEVSEVVRAAAANGRRVAAQCTGHNAAPLGSLAGTVLLRTAGLGGVQIDAAAGSARVGAGALWGDVVPEASELGLAALHGSTPNVGIAGYTLGGGVGFYHRKHGLACNRVTAIELVTARLVLLGPAQLLNALNTASKATENYAAEYSLSMNEDSIVVEAAKIPASSIRAGFLFNCWLETLCTAEIRVLGWLYREFYGRPFHPESF